MDVLRLNAAVRRGVGKSGGDFASSLVEELVRHESASVSVDLDISADDEEKRQGSLALYYAITQGIVRGAEAIVRESGLRSLWLAYPYLLARDITDPDHKRSILAPLYLWPIQIHASLKKQGELTILREKEAGAPVFNRVLARWARMNLKVDISPVELDANGDGEIELSEVDVAVRSMLNGFPSLEVADLTLSLSPVPARKDAETMKQPAVLNAAVLGLFLSENQALMENLEQLQQLQAVDDPLDSILANRQAQPEPVQLPTESQRYLVTDSDPYQERAIWESRKSPGTIVHGPPGTGKSQTIVNIVADSLARRERVLVVCQKRAAIDVVAERLRAVGLDDLCVVVHDSESDRRKIFSDLKEQINALKEYVPGGFAGERQRLSEDIDRREAGLEQYHKALLLPRQPINLSYRQLIGRATSLYNDDSTLRSDPHIEAVFSSKGIEDLDRAEAELRELVHLWEASLPRVNPWTNRATDFALTRPIHDEIVAVIQSCIEAGDQLDQFGRTNGLGAEIEGNAAAFISAAEEWREWTMGLFQTGRVEGCAYWLQRFSADNTGGSIGISGRLEQLASLADQFTRIPRDHGIETTLGSSEGSQLERLLQSIESLKRRHQRGWWVLLTPSYHKALKVWNSHGLPSELRASLATLEAVEQQGKRRSNRLRVLSGLASLDLPSNPSSLDAELVETVRVNLAGSRDAAKLAGPSKRTALLATLANAVRRKGRAALEQWDRGVKTAVARAHLLVTLGGELHRLQRWLRTEYLEQLLSRAQGGESVRPHLERLISYLPRLSQLCAFDATRAAASDLISQTLSALAAAATESDVKVWDGWKTILRYSAYSVWINACLKETPILQSLTPELFERDRKALATAISKKRALEVRAIRDSWLEHQAALHSLRPSPLVALRSQLVTRGPNSKRLRQAVAFGAEQGLFTLRPCWMMNPNTACQIFQLAAGLFDVVIFDEASQCPLEQAVPILHRGKRAVVAGDEKQLPPTSFFLSVTPFDDDEDSPSDEEISLEEQVQRDLRRDVLATKDLLSVCESVLRNSYLDMHYRSEHPFLIQFSNKAFYGGRLQCPPSVKSDGADAPIIVVRAENGVYERPRQVNEIEARTVVQLLRKLWFEQGLAATIGVVTFNLKQEDLIQNLLQAEALRDEEFRVRYESECDRQDGRQDVSFFVKNLESVQGDERDIMIFSTTFGYDQQGQFKRFFGPLNAEGGERRLNVAVTRAKKRIYVVTSLPVAQISDVFGAAGSRPATRVSGRDYLQAYMRYAEAVCEDNHKLRETVEKQLGELGKMAGISARQPDHPPDFDSDFELSVYEALTKQGLRVDQQVGDSGFRIDLAIRHPKREDCYVLGLECDGRTYHSQFTARARDIWRQQILESRGWRIHRIWSTNWWLDPQAEVDKVLARISALEME